MQLIYEDRSEMQRALKKANIKDVFIRQRDASIRVTALIDNRSLASFQCEAVRNGVEGEIALWKAEHFDVSRGEVVLDAPPNPAGRGIRD